MKEKHALMYMDIAETVAKQSYATRLKVGAVAVNDNRILSIGYNGTPPGWDNACENIIPSINGSIPTTVTKPEVIHAEENCILKMARDGQAAKGSDLFITHNPCGICAKMIITAGIKKVWWRNHYRDDAGLDMLTKANIELERI